MLTVRRVGYALGAEVTGVDLTKPLDVESERAIKQAFLDHCVLVFPGQDLSAAQLMEFSRHFGILDDNRGAPPPCRHPIIEEVLVLSNQPVTVDGKQAQKSPPADKWHADYTYVERIPLATVLLAKHLPPVGGDTLFANMYVAYETLSPAFKAILEPLWILHDVTFGAAARTKSAQELDQWRKETPPTSHPIVTAHPQTGRKTLLLSEQRLRNFVGMTEEETKPIVDFLIRHATRYEFVYRHRWRPDDLVILDNRCLMHHAVMDYDQAELRWMIRCAVLPELVERREPVALTG